MPNYHILCAMCSVFYVQNASAKCKRSNTKVKVVALRVVDLFLFIGGICSEDAKGVVFIHD